jgi:hypothetical protein
MRAGFYERAAIHCFRSNQPMADNLNQKWWNMRKDSQLDKLVAGDFSIVNSKESLNMQKRCFGESLLGSKVHRSIRS